MHIEDGEAVKFLERDFNQCFMQLRHYDSQIWNICRFAFTAYISILGTALGLYHYSVEKSLNLIPAAIGVLGAGLVLGFLLYSLVICNRAYYVLVCRYINEHRKFFLEGRPFGFENVSGMYMNSAIPPYFNWRSWQSWLCYLIASLNAALLTALLIFYFSDEYSWRWPLTITIGIITALIQIGSGIIYLKSREDKIGSEGISAKE
ncbi:MAG: hypothetical protein F4219_05840 [Gammaproteobacteria bacterium]|nr:hypothetical protein [Gammaproteobacteria bacterium]